MDTQLIKRCVRFLKSLRQLSCKIWQTVAAYNYTVSVLDVDFLPIYRGIIGGEVINMN